MLSDVMMCLQNNLSIEQMLSAVFYSCVVFKPRITLGLKVHLDVVVDGRQEDDGLTPPHVGDDLSGGLLDRNDVKKTCWKNKAAYHFLRPTT